MMASVKSSKQRLRGNDIAQQVSNDKNTKLSILAILITCLQR
jgi:hypothetical protein